MIRLISIFIKSHRNKVHLGAPASRRLKDYRLSLHAGEMLPIFLLLMNLVIVSLTAGETGTDLRTQSPEVGENSSMPSSARKEKYGTRDVEVRLIDGSILKGELLNLDSIILKTTFGTLTFPTRDILRVCRGHHLTPDKTSDIFSAIKDLDDSEFGRRLEAQRKLELWASEAAGMLEEARAHASAEACSRIDGLLRKIAEKGGNKFQVNDFIYAKEFKAKGIIQHDRMTIKGRMGTVNIEIENIESIDWLGKGDIRSVKLDGTDSTMDWIDTHLDLESGFKVAACCTGTLNFGDQYQISPIGGSNWNNGLFLAGAVIAKIGVDGDPFLIGKGKQWIAERSERIFVKIYYPENFKEQSRMKVQGCFNLRMTTGAWVDELPGISKE